MQVLLASFEPRRDRTSTGWRFARKPTRHASSRQFESQPAEARGRYEPTLHARPHPPSGSYAGTRSAVANQHNGEPSDSYSQANDIHRSVEVVKAQENAHDQTRRQRCQSHDCVTTSGRPQTAMTMNRTGGGPPWTRHQHQERDAEDRAVDRTPSVPLQPPRGATVLLRSAKPLGGHAAHGPPDPSLPVPSAERQIGAQFSGAKPSLALSSS
jgi:hypothetical protein